MAEHLTEEEQVEALKKWWKENGNAIIIGLIIGLGAVIGVRYWFTSQEERAITASDAYTRFSEAVVKNDKETSHKLATEIREKYKGTTYAALVALQMAKQNIEANKLADAEADLQWALDNPGHESIALVARQRLAIVLTAEGKLDAALVLLEQAKDKSFEPRYALVKGDIFSKQGKVEQAREAYQLALTDTTLSGKDREYVEMKLENLPKPAQQDTAK